MLDIWLVFRSLAGLSKEGFLGSEDQPQKAFERPQYYIASIVVNDWTHPRPDVQTSSHTGPPKENAQSNLSLAVLKKSALLPSISEPDVLPATE